MRAPAGIRSRLWWKAALLLMTLAITLLLPWWLGGAGTFTAVIAFPLPLLALMVALAVICWNLNAARLRLMLDGRAGRLGQGGALAIEMSSKFRATIAFTKPPNANAPRKTPSPMTLERSPCNC